MRKLKTKLDSVLDGLRSRGWKADPVLVEAFYYNIIDVGFIGKNLRLACVATELALKQKPITLRGLFYQVVSAGWLPDTNRKHYTRLGRILTVLREAGIVPFSWIVDNVRDTDKPSSWAGITDFVDTVQDAYRRDFWSELPEYVHVFAEKDAIAGVLSPVTHKFDVALSPVRGYVSLSYAHEIAELWNQIDKPITAYYLGDFDPSGFDLERDLRDKLSRYCKRAFTWRRLAVNAEDFDEFNLLPLNPKTTDRRYKTFVEQHGTACAEVDALPATELRRRVREAIESHIPEGEWDRLQEVERLERESFNKALAGMKPVGEAA